MELLKICAAISLLIVGFFAGISILNLGVRL